MTGVKTRHALVSSVDHRKNRDYVTWPSFDKPGHVRLDKAKRHWHKQCKKRSMCKLHRLWGQRTYSNVFDCEDCDDSLCIDCWRDFHEVIGQEAMENSLLRRLGKRDSPVPSTEKEKKRRLSDVEIERLDGLPNNK